MVDKELTKKQMVAIYRNIKLGGILQQDHPKIADLYRQGYTLSKIAEELNIMFEYDVSYRVARIGVHNAITGHNGSFNINAYNGLINVDERIRIGKEHMSEGSRKGGIKGGRARAIALGFILWTEEETALAYQLSQNSQYHWDTGTHKGKLNLKKIINKLIEEGYPNRTPGVVGHVIQQCKKSLEDRV